MKKIIILIVLLMPLAFVANAQKSNLKKLQVLDYSHNPVRHWRIYVFETMDKQPTDMKQLLANLTATKGVQKIAPHESDKIARILIYTDENLVLSQSKELKSAFANANFDLTNIPNETK